MISTKWRSPYSYHFYFRKLFGSHTADTSVTEISENTAEEEPVVQCGGHGVFSDTYHTHTTAALEMNAITCNFITFICGLSGQTFCFCSRSKRMKLCLSLMLMISGLWRRHRPRHGGAASSTVASQQEGLDSQSGQGVSVWTSHVLPVSAWIRSRRSQFLPQPMLTNDRK